MRTSMLRPLLALMVFTPLHAPAARAQSPGTGEVVRGNAVAEGEAGEGGAVVVRFHAAETDLAKLPPSLALADPGAIKVRGAGGGAVQPKFWKAEDGRFCTRVDVEAGTSLYGTGEIAGPLLRNGRKTVCWNTDAYGYTEEMPSLYQSHPWVLAVRADGTSFGVLADTTWRCEIDLSEGIVFRGEGSPYAVYVVDGASPQEVVKGLAGLIGTMPLPPKWAIGYHQCRYSYYPEKKVREIAEGFRSRKLPCDVIWFDIDYMDKYKVFSFDTSAAGFPDVRRLNDDLDAMGFARIWMIDPGVKAEPGYSVFDSGMKEDVFVKNAAGGLYKGEVWPGQCVFPDYTRPQTRAWWAGLYKGFMSQGVSGVWNDMNEPAVFNVKSKTMPEDNQHRGGALAGSGGSGGGELPAGPHLQYHNVYGMLMARGTFEGIKSARPDVRPFVLTRAGYIGSQRYAATWTGDNNAEWKDLEQSVPMVLNLGLSGQPFCGPDIGGFNGNGDGKLFARWFGLGTLLPFSRGHTGKGNIDKEPWAFGLEIEATCRKALERRYRLMPYLYSAFEEASRTGMPVARPLFFADPQDPALRSEDDGFLLGADVLVVGKLTPERDRVVSRPKGKWQRLYLAGEGENADLPELAVREGAIVPLGPVIQYTGEQAVKPTGERAPIGSGVHPLTLAIALDKDGKADGTVYEDSGDGFEYQRGAFLRTTYRATSTGTKVRVEIASKEGSMVRPARRLHIMILKDGWFYPANAVDGQPITMDLARVAPVQMNN